ncbi:ATP-binding protein [Paenibacillus nanensis]|uniref:ATP-binding protein n=1 Tax=Paenibacillus nanensis TaxID=393251 RepID=A0A3A1VJA5_9BACL|nr:DUF87 domain-containing protein [Paenibacillus nanensis]RIX59706.1 ATP-binding protein [Paenibacillus nanensis]
MADALTEIQRLQRLHSAPEEARLKSTGRAGNDYRFFQIKKISVAEESETEPLHAHVNRCVSQFLASLADAASPVLLRIVSSSEGNTISFYIGSKPKGNRSLSGRFRSYFQGAELIEAELQEGREVYSQHGLITGIPARSETDVYAHLVPLLRWMAGKDIMLEVAAKPVHRLVVHQQLKQAMELRTDYSAQLKVGRSESRATSETYSTSQGETSTDGGNNGGSLVLVNSGETWSEGSTQSTSDSTGVTETKTTNLEVTDSRSTELDRLLEQHIERLREAITSGLWRTVVSIYANNRIDLTDAGEIYRSGYNRGAIEPYQLFVLGEPACPTEWFERDQAAVALDIFQERFREYSFVTTEELSRLLELPKEDFNGYEFSRAPRFSQNPLGWEGIPLGHLYDGEQRTDAIFRLDPNQLVKHMLVAGITGSGKTNTIFNLLREVKVPFLIIEPAKKEYRSLKAAFPNLRVYTLGQEAVSPLRLNPFYFEPSVNIQQHIDNLKVIFNAAFTMYASMPNILEQCITNVYMKKGWSLTTSRNIYQSHEGHYHKYFPTIEDLYHEIDQYTRELGYAQEQMQNIRAALLTRMKSLMTGGKGAMLNTVEVLNMEELLACPTVLELDAVADDDEKSLVIGLISVFIYEYLKAKTVNFTGDLKHLLVLEEAHRIFANVQQQGNPETVNIKGKAVESLSHILSEIRAYGEGMIVVDQVPTKLSPDVLKNTNTKIIHRIVSRDDCEYVANSLGMPDEKVSFISRLQNGAALIYSDGMSGPAHLQILHGKQGIAFVPDRELAEGSRAYNLLLHRIRPQHPLTEIIMQNMDAYGELKKLAGEFYRVLLREELRNLPGNYAAVKEKIVSQASEYGFDLSAMADDFIRSFLREALFYMVRTDSRLGLQINKRIRFERYIECVLELLTKQYDENEKEYTLLELNRRRLEGEHAV